jgi:hypothetical protein
VWAVVDVVVPLISFFNHRRIALQFNHTLWRNWCITKQEKIIHVTEGNVDKN